MYLPTPASNEHHDDVDVVDVSGLELTSRCNHVVDARVDGVVGQRGHALGVDAAKRLVVRLRTGLREPRSPSRPPWQSSRQWP